MLNSPKAAEIDLLLASSLVHAVPGSFLTVEDAGGRHLRVAAHPAADIVPCRWRASLLRLRDAGATLGLQVVDVGGRLAAGPGCFLDCAHPARRWLATCLPVSVVVSVLESEPERRPVDVVVRPDPGLGVCVLSVDAGVDDVDDLALGIRARLAVAELAYELSAA